MPLTKETVMPPAKRKTGQVEAAADTSQPGLEAKAQAAAAETGVPLPPEPTSYRYLGPQDAVVVVIDGTSYDFRKGEQVHLAHPDKGLDDHPEFERVS